MNKYRVTVYNKGTKVVESDSPIHAMKLIDKDVKLTQATMSTSNVCIEKISGNRKTRNYYYAIGLKE